MYNENKESTGVLARSQLQIIYSIIYSIVVEILPCYYARRYIDDQSHFVLVYICLTA